MRFAKHHERDNNNQNAQFSQVLELQEQVRPFVYLLTAFIIPSLVAEEMQD